MNENNGIVEELRYFNNINLLLIFVMKIKHINYLSSYILYIKLIIEINKSHLNSDLIK